MAEHAPAPRPGGQSGKLKKPVHKLKFHGKGGDLLVMHLINMCLTAMTLGIYHFWAKVKVRKYMFSQLEFQKERFSYHGNGKELLIGWIKAFGIFFVLGLVNALVMMTKNEALIGVSLLIFYGVVLAIVPFAIVGSRKYLLSRTALMGIRFSFRGDAKELVKLFIPNALLTAVTLGLYAPFFQAKMQNWMMSHSYYGNTPFRSEVEGKETFKDFIIALVLHIPTLGLVWLWYGAKQQRYYASKLRFANGRFESDVTAMDLFKLVFVNMLLIGLTAGLAFPWVIVRNMNFMCQHLVLKGNVDFAAIQQEARLASATGDGFAEALDLDVGVGM
jgi:uncharacterized membrane protein YjgN (DUF898 family)